MNGNGKNISFNYNDSGIRTQKVVGTVTINYHLVGGKVSYEDNGTDKIYYSYDSSDHLISMNLNGEEYFYIRNAQGDIIGLCDKSGVEVVSYSYDSFGKLTPSKAEMDDANDTDKNGIMGSLATIVGIKNPYLYRGYRFDSETGLYYLQSRHYNPSWGRFLNADAIIGSAGELLGHNVFAYCKNNFVNGKDPSGFRPVYTEGEETDEMRDASYKVMNRPKTKKRPTKTETHNSGDLRICTDGTGSGANDPDHRNDTALIVGDYLNADITNYIVLPGGYKGPAKLGDIGIILDVTTGRYVYAIIGEVGPDYATFGEVSIVAAKRLGYSNATGQSGPSGNFQIILFPGTRQGWKYDHLQDQINAAGLNIIW